jgi:hypothetical protein
MTDVARRRFIHDVGAKCASLKDAAALLKDASPKDFEELLDLMVEQAAALQREIAGNRKKRGA